MPQPQGSDKSEPRPNVKENLNEVVTILIFLGSPKKKSDLFIKIFSVVFDMRKK